MTILRKKYGTTEEKEITQRAQRTKLLYSVSAVNDLCALCGFTQPFKK